MLIGYAQNVITPSLKRPVLMAGFDKNRRATGIHLIKIGPAVMQAFQNLL